MLKKAKNAANAIPRSGTMLVGIVSMLFDLLKHWLHDIESGRSSRKVESMTQHFSDVEHMMIRLEEKLNHNRKEIEDLKSKLYLSSVLIIGLLVTVCVQLFNM